MRLSNRRCLSRVPPEVVAKENTAGPSRVQFSTSRAEVSGDFLSREAFGNPVSRGGPVCDAIALDPLFVEQESHPPLFGASVFER